MQKIIHALFGYILIEIKGETALKAINTLRDEKRIFWGFRREGDSYFLKSSVFSATDILKSLEESKAEAEAIKEAGLPFIFHRYKNRAGLIAGTFLALALIYVSTLFVWDIRINCNGDYDEKAVTEALYRLGLKEGAYLPEFDVYKTELTFLVENPRYSDIAINLEGTAACVELRVRTSPPEASNRSGVFDIVAARDGVIYSISATNGEPAVQKGDTVQKGEVLINGIITGKYGASYALHAAGEVKAYVYYDYYVLIPLQTTEKVYTGEIKTKSSYRILGRSFDLFLSELSPFERSDAVAKSERVTLFGSVKLPLRADTVTYREYVIRDIEISEDAALARAENAFASWCARNIKGEIIRTEPQYRYDEDLGGIVYTAMVEAIEDIAVEKELNGFELTD